MKPRTLAVVEARMGSTRMPDTLLGPSGGRPLLVQIIEQARESRRLQALVVATSWRPEDDAVLGAAEEQGVPCLRGPDNDLLARLALVARLLKPERLVRLSAVRPFADVRLLDCLVDAQRRAGADYAGYLGLPQGTEPEVMDCQALLAADGLASDLAERADGTALIRRRSDLFRCIWLPAPPGLARSEPSPAVDAEADPSFVSTLCV